MIPRATYRVQFHAGFRFDQAAELADYLADLGISHLYASPIATARTGSTHGYDVVDPTNINPTLGGEDGFRAMAAALRARDIGVILDIVPNHMAVGGADNPWWLDVLAKGQQSPFAPYFDIDWTSGDPALTGKLLAPFLGLPYGDALTSGALQLETDGSAVLAHGNHLFPIRREDRATLAAEKDLANRYDGRRIEGAARLHALLERQHYRLAWWRTAADQINWRRFFDITELAGLRVEDDRVFDAVHALPLRLFAEGLIDGVRVDHVDGLANPAAYVRKLRAALCAGRETPGYLIVEKILAPDEALPRSWGADGTTGYDFMNEISALLHDPAGEPAITELWEKTSDRSGVFADEEYIARVELLDRTFPGQLAAACAAFLKIARRNIAERDVTSGAILRALVGLLTHFEGYRTYIGSCDDNALRLRNAARSARATAAWGEADLPETLCAWILDSQSRDDEIRDAARRFEQLSAPLAAKAVEDTAFYRFGRLLSRNDVGFDPGRFSQSPDEFCRRFAKRAHDFPHAMLATATHDHKRGEDVRARLAVVSEMPAAWRRFVARFTAEDLGGEIAPADRYQILQTIVGAWPLGTIDCTFKARVEQWCVKSLREAKLRSSWVQPSEQYEQSCSAFISSIIDDAQCRRMVIDFVDTIAPAGALNGLVQTLLRVSLPGIPDCYQGAELWDFSLVDPDNRRPIDYGLRQNIGSWDDYGNLVRDWRDGRVKQALIAHALALRREHQTVFSAPLTSLAVTGQQSDHIFAFRRSTPSVELLVVVPLHSAAGLDCGDKISLSRGWLGDTIIHNGPEPISAADILDVAPIAIRLRSA